MRLEVLVHSLDALGLLVDSRLHGLLDEVAECAFAQAAARADRHGLLDDLELAVLLELREVVFLLRGCSLQLLLESLYFVVEVADLLLQALQLGVVLVLHFSVLRLDLLDAAVKIVQRGAAQLAFCLWSDVLDAVDHLVLVLVKLVLFRFELVQQRVELRVQVAAQARNVVALGELTGALEVAASELRLLGRRNALERFLQGSALRRGRLQVMNSSA